MPENTSSRKACTVGVTFAVFQEQKIRHRVGRGAGDLLEARVGNSFSCYHLVSTSCVPGTRQGDQCVSLHLIVTNTSLGCSFEIMCLLSHLIGFLKTRKGSTVSFYIASHIVRQGVRYQDFILWKPICPRAFSSPFGNISSHRGYL